MKNLLSSVGLCRRCIVRFSKESSYDVSTVNYYVSSFKLLFNKIREFYFGQQKSGISINWQMLYLHKNFTTSISHQFVQIHGRDLGLTEFSGYRTGSGMDHPGECSGRRCPGSMVTKLNTSKGFGGQR